MVAAPQNDAEALTLGLHLTLTALTEALALQAVAMANVIAGSLDPDTVEGCKAAALERAEAVWEMRGT